MKCDTSFEDCFCGVATIGERGQVVIPADARKKLGISSGDKLMVMFHPSSNGIMLFKMDAMRQFVTNMMEGLSKIEQDVLPTSDGASEPNG